MSTKKTNEAPTELPKGVVMPEIDDNKLDATMLQKAKFDFTKDMDKLQKYGLVPENHVVDATNADQLVPVETDPEVVLAAAEIRAEEYGKEVDGYIKELRIAVDRFSKHSPKEMVKSNYQRYESYDLAVAAVDTEDPYKSIF